MTKSQFIAGAEPFYYRGNRIGCLLLHGFTGTPNEMRELGQHLFAQGYSALGPALAGHATKLEDMYPTRWQDWYATATDGYDRLSEHCDAIIPIGLSLGAALALYLAAQREVAAVVALSAPSSVNNWRKVFFQIFPLLFRLVPAIKKDLSRSDTQDPWVREHHLRYNAYPTVPAASMIRDFFPRMVSHLPRVRAPVLLMQARGDRTIPQGSMETVYARLGSRHKDMFWLERGGHLVLEDYAKAEAFEKITQFVAAHVPAAQVNQTLRRAPSLA